MTPLLHTLPSHFVTTLSAHFHKGGSLATITMLSQQGIVTCIQCDILQYRKQSSSKVNTMNLKAPSMQLQREKETYIKLFLLIFICTTFVYMEHPYKHTEANIQLVGHQQGCTCYSTAREPTLQEKKTSFASSMH